MSHPLWRRVSRIGYVSVLAGATAGGAYVGTQYYRHGSLPELPQWAQQFADRMPQNVVSFRPQNESVAKQSGTERQKAEAVNAQKIAELEKQLAEQKALERQKIAAAVEEQRKKDERKASESSEPKRTRDSAAIDPVDLKAKKGGPSRPKVTPRGPIDDAFESQLTDALDTANRHAKAAANAKYQTVQALQLHTKLMKEAVDSDVKQKGGEGGGDLPKWDEVKLAKAEADRRAKLDTEKEGTARDAIKELEKLILTGSQKSVGDDEPLLLNARETANKLSSRLDEMNLLLGREQAQMRIFTNYRDLVEQGRQQWAEELNSIFPGIDLRAKQGQLSHEELDAFIVHANIRVDQLKRQLAEHQALEEQRVLEAVEEQRKLDESLSKMALEFERRRNSGIAETDLDAKIEQQRRAWEAELDAQLKRAAIAHAEHLERVIKTQKQIHDVENEQLVQEAVAIERNKFDRQIGNALVKLAAIEETLKSRAAKDLENRRAKIYWTICQSLTDALVSGGTAGAQSQKTPYKTTLKEIALLKQLTENDTFAQSVCAHFPSGAIERGVPTEQGLIKRFDRVHKLARCTAQIGDEGGTLLRYVASWLQSLVTFELPAAYSADDRLDLNRYEPYELLARCRHFVQQKDLLNAVRVANLIRGESARIFSDWLNDAKAHLEVRLLVELLFAHAQATGIRTTY
ncbi:hypothetical protein niasHT_032126 [Heterodera trifolii]|uniref:MICOS complex subunit MIC60 n=1 Tax=Heterodera trifolii TaxID=157864 RepID=A0ABD2HVA1_9BILA